MNDRELLETAAKAAGISVFWGHPGSCQYKSDKLYRELDGRMMYTAPEWNPLEDDGDALRLAVKRGVKFRWHSTLHQAFAWAPLGMEVVVNGEDCGGDSLAATRRAIVLAVVSK